MRPHSRWHRSRELVVAAIGSFANTLVFTLVIMLALGQFGITRKTDLGIDKRVMIVAKESADVVLSGNDLGRLVETLTIARWCRRIIITNFVGTLVVDGIGMILAAFGYLNPLLAALIHVGSELLFIMNSARLLPGKTSNKKRRSPSCGTSLPAPALR